MMEGRFPAECTGISSGIQSFLLQLLRGIRERDAVDAVLSQIQKAVAAGWSKTDFSERQKQLWDKYESHGKHYSKCGGIVAAIIPWAIWGRTFSWRKSRGLLFTVIPSFSSGFLLTRFYVDSVFVRNMMSENGRQAESWRDHCRKNHGHKMVASAIGANAGQ